MRARIVEAAADLVYSGGVGGLCLDDVMAASGASKSQMYHYFADKDDLVDEVVALQTKRVLSLQRRHLLVADSFAALQAWRDAMIAMTRARSGIGGCPIGSLANELADVSEPVRERLAGGFAQWGADIEGALRRMRDAGALAPSADPRAIATAVLCAIQGGLLLAKATRSADPLEVALDMALAHVARHRSADGAGEVSSLAR